MICLKDVYFSYSEQGSGTLHNINLTIEEGECVLLCGRSGCGKTSITRMINGLIPNFYAGEFSGQVTLNGANVSEIPMHKLSARIGSVFQNPRTQFFNVDTDSEIAFGIENLALVPEELKRRVEAATTDLHIENLRGRSIFELSGGEKQKIAFASIYAMNPDIYLLDEPSSNLDMQSVADLREHLRLVKKQGKTIIIAEHRLYYLFELVDKIVYIDDGRIQNIFTADEVLALASEQLAAMGLRSVDLRRVRPKEREKQSFSVNLLLNKISLRHKKQVILKDISLTAGYGEIIGVTGQNGAGKTTFSRALCGLHKGQSGNVSRNNTGSNQKKRLSNSYMVMQDVNYQLFAESVEKECSFGIKQPNESLVALTMERLGLQPLRDKHPNTLSGGQKQRIAVAVSMICNKELLVFDEPTSGLDYDSMVQVSALIKELAGMGKIIFIVTHDYEFICHASTRIIHFDGGALTQDFAVERANEALIKKLFSLTNEKGGLMP